MKVSKVIDLSVTVKHDDVVWPGSPAPEIRKIYIGPPTGTVEMVKFHTHTGTHVDAPYHQLERGVSIDQMPVEVFLGYGTVIDLSYKKPKERITSADLEEHGLHVKEDDIVFIYTGWGRKRDFTIEYMQNFPALDESAAEWLVKKRVKGVGIDTLGIEPFAEISITKVHRIIMEKGIWNVETLTNLDKLLVKKRWFFIVLPIKLAGCGGAQCRAIAVDFVE